MRAAGSSPGQRLAEEAGVTIRLNTEATPELVAQGNPR